MANAKRKNHYIAGAEAKVYATINQTPLRLFSYIPVPRLIWEKNWLSLMLKSVGFKAIFVYFSTHMKMVSEF
jgi:hypothetical protein